MKTNCQTLQGTKNWELIFSTHSGKAPVRPRLEIKWSITAALPAAGAHSIQIWYQSDNESEVSSNNHAAAEAQRFIASQTPDSPLFVHLLHHDGFISQLPVATSNTINKKIGFFRAHLEPWWTTTLKQPSKKKSLAALYSNYTLWSISYAWLNT